MWPAEDLPRAPPEFPPPWASAWGDDPYGLWAELDVKGVVQRMRWIEPGEFLMGSPVTEEGRDEDEGPLHRVVLSEGFWLADTLCSQTLWVAVMGGEDPSHFKGQDLPVEQVSWDDVQGFLQALRVRFPDVLTCDLPTEAQWEYACRAGTATAYWWGNAPDASRANMASSKLGKTTALKLYRPSPWGLHDMHGNLWEWCADARRTYRDQAELDPHGGTEGADRALRGGSWGSGARYCRSAFRDGDHRDYRIQLRGFRFAVRSVSPGGGAAGR